MTQENFYSILGVGENATQDEIKKAYRDKSKIHHPDRGGSEDEFKKINEAYSILSDDRKKHEYDNRKNNPFGSFEGGFGDIFDMFNFGGGNFQKRKPTNPDKIIEIEVTPIDSYLATEKNIQFVRNEACDTCRGKGGDRINCHLCNGQGFFAKTVSNGFFNQIMRSVCNGCGGNGYILQNKCRTCSGLGKKHVVDSVKINLPHGIDDGQFLKIQNKGDFNNGTYGNLLLKVKMIKTQDFEKINNDLVYNKYFNFEELSNDSFNVPHPSGEINIKFPKDFDTSVPLRVKGKGYRSNTLGDLYVKMNVKFTRKD